MKQKLDFLIPCLFLAISLSLMACSKWSAFNKKSSNGSASMIRGKMFTGKKGGKAGTLFTSFYDATKRSTLTYVTPNGQPRILSENNPDAAANRAFDLITSLNLTNSKDSAVAQNKLSLARTIVQLTDKSPTNIFVRDALYRLNEMYINTLCLNCKDDSTNKNDTCKSCGGDTHSQALTRNNYEVIFTKVLEAAEIISSSDAKEAEAKLKQMQITDSVAKLKSNIKILNDSINKLNKPIKVDTIKKDTIKPVKTIGALNFKIKYNISITKLNSHIIYKYTLSSYSSLKAKKEELVECFLIQPRCDI
jgi:hypothetical protein